MPDPTLPEHDLALGFSSRAVHAVLALDLPGHAAAFRFLNALTVVSSIDDLRADLDAALRAATA